MKRELRYVGPSEQLVGRLARLDRHRQHVANELRALDRFLAEHPELAPRACAPTPRLRLVVDNDSPSLKPDAT